MFGRNGPLTIAVLDGPYDPSLLGVLARPPRPLRPGTCADQPAHECGHGTFILGLLGARPDAEVPGLCPGCLLLHAPLFLDGRQVEVSTDDLADAILLALEAGAAIINLSLAVIEDGLTFHRRLSAALDDALRAGAIVVTAVGNQGRFVSGPLLSHAATIPVAATDREGRRLPLSNLSPSAARQGVSALGHDVPGYAPGGSIVRLTGTSIAAAVATGRIAALWSRFPHISAAHVRAAITGLQPRRGLVPPTLHSEALAAALGRAESEAPRVSRWRARTQGTPDLGASQRGRRVTMEAITEPRDRPTTHDMPGAAVALAHAEGDCGCGGKGGCTCGSKAEAAAPPAFVFALGSVEVQFPDPALEQEIRDVAAMTGVTGQENSPAWLYNVLRDPAARYVARQLCYLFTVEGQPAYALRLRDATDFDTLIQALAPGERGQDVDLVVGVRGPMAPPEMCGGVLVPMLLVDQLMSFKRGDLIGRIPAPAGADEDAFRDTAEAVFDRLVQIADNVGATDAHRALNFLAVRYVPLYQLAADMERRGFQLTAVEVGVSRLSGTRKIVAPIFTFQNRTTNGFVEKYFVRVDVRYEFPMIATHLQPYFDR